MIRKQESRFGIWVSSYLAVAPILLIAKTASRTLSHRRRIVYMPEIFLSSVQPSFWFIRLNSEKPDKVLNFYQLATQSYSSVPVVCFEHSDAAFRKTTAHLKDGS